MIWSWLTLVLTLQTLSALPSVVSINLCTDRLLMLLADRSQVRSLTWLSGLSKSEEYRSKISGIHLNSGQAEEVVRLKPDLILAGTFTTRFTVALLRRLGHRVIELPPVENLNDIRTQISQIALAVGQEERGDQVIREMNKKIESIRKQKMSGESALFFRPGGWTAGFPSLEDDLLKTIGIKNLASELGIKSWGSTTVEALLRVRPDFIIVPSDGIAHSLSQQLLRHPAFESQGGLKKIYLEPELLSCGTPATLLAGEQILQASGIKNEK